MLQCRRSRLFYCSDFRSLNQTLHFILIFDVVIHIWLIIICLDLGEAEPPPSYDLV